MANNCKFQKTQYQVSYDSGRTWQNVVPEQIRKGSLIEYDSSDCTSIETIYRWQQLYGQYLCDNHVKYTKEIMEESYDQGITWYTSYPTTYRKGYAVGIDMNYCNEKFVGHYIYTGDDHRCGWGAVWNGIRCDDGRHLRTDPLKVVKCNDRTSLTEYETEYYTPGYLLTACTIGDCVSIIGGFYGYTGIKSIGSIGSGASVEIPDSVIRIGNGAFEECSSLTSVTIPDSVTSIGNQSFAYCSGLTSLTIPSGVTSIGPYAFANCTHLTGITVEAIKPPSLGNYAFDSTNNCPIYIHCEAINSYMTNNSWSAYRDRLRIIEEPCQFSYKLKTDTGQYVYCDGSSTLTRSEVSAVTISNTAEIGDCVTSIGDSAFVNKSIKYIDIPSGVTSIGANAFSYITTLSSITISDSVTSIGNSTFKSCTGLKEIVLPSGLTSVANETFANCTSLSSVTIPNSVSSIGNKAFISTKIQSIELTDITNIGEEAFTYCNRLTTINIKNSNGINGNIGEWAFSGCTNLSKAFISIGNKTSNNSGGTIGAHAFVNTSLQYAELSVGTIGKEAFYGSTLLKSVVFSQTTPPSMGSGAFNNSIGAADGYVYVPYSVVDTYKSASGWNTTWLKNRIVALSWLNRWQDSGTTCVGCDKYQNSIEQYSRDSGNTWINVTPEQYSATTLIEAESCDCCPTVTKHRWYPSGYTCIGYDKYQNNIRQESDDCGVTWENVVPEEYSASTLIEIDSEDCGYVPPKWIATYSGGSTSSAGCDSSSAITSGEISLSGLQSVVIGDCVTSIGYSSFENCVSLSSVTIPNNVTSIGYSSFENCSGLTSVIIPSGVTSINYGTFYNCRRLTNISIPSGVTSIGDSAFYGCSGLTSVTIPSGVTTIDYMAFYNCRSLTSITIEATTPPSLEGYVFNNTNNCPIYVPYESMEVYRTSTGWWSNYTNRITFIRPESYKWVAIYTGDTISSANCSSTSSISQNEISLTNIQSVDIGNCVTSIGQDAFLSATTLSSVTIGSGVRSIGTGAFYNCTSLTSVVIPDSVTTIGNWAFGYCSGLRSVALPSSVTSIGSSAFGYCSGLRSITIEATSPPTLGNYVFDNTTCTIYVPASSVETYKAASGWKTYKSRIVGF